MALGHVTFTGHLAKDPQTYTTPGGQMVVNFTVGTSRRKKDQQDNWTDVDQTFIDCAVWQKFEGDTLPQRIAALEKGAPVIVEGEVYMKVSESQGRTYRNVACHVKGFGQWWKPARDQQPGGWSGGQGGGWSGGGQQQPQAQQGSFGGGATDDPWNAAPAPDESPF